MITANNRDTGMSKEMMIPAATLRLGACCDALRSSFRTMCSKDLTLTNSRENSLKKDEGKLKLLGNVLYLVLNDKPDNLNGYPSNYFLPYIYRAGGVSHWDRCLSLFTRSLRYFFAPASRLPLSANFLTSKNNDK